VPSTGARRGGQSPTRHGSARSAAALTLTTAGRARREGPSGGRGQRGAGVAGRTKSAARGGGIAIEDSSGDSSSRWWARRGGARGLATRAEVREASGSVERVTQKQKWVGPAIAADLFSARFCSPAWSTPRVFLRE
jgi:hypothetical protein